jgi:hypothetical protein
MLINLGIAITRMFMARRHRQIGIFLLPPPTN